MNGGNHSDLRDHLETRLAGLKSVRTPYEDEARDIARFAQPARSRFLASNKDKPEARRQRNRKLLDSHGIEAFRTLTNGMTSGLSSPSRPWFTLKLADRDLNDQPGVREWLSDVEREMYGFMARTNFYGAMKAGYAELGLFGTEACVMVEHPTVGAVCHALTFGEYWIGLSNALQPDTLIRRCPMDVKQAVQSFRGSVSQIVLNAYDKSNYDQPVDVYHAIEPNPDYDPNRLGSKPYRSIYWDAATNRNEVLRVSGYDSQPFWAPRWDVVGGDTYGVSPGMEALPALRELQMQTKRRNEAIDMMVKPEKVVPAGLRLTGQPNNTVSGTGVTREQIIVPYQMPYQAVAAIGAEIDKCYTQIDALSFADLFNAITNMRGVQPRNVEEIASRNEEKLTQLGPVIERVANEKLEVAIDRVFDIMQRGGLLPPVPEALSEARIEVEFVSILAQMQRMVGVGQIERAAGFLGSTAGVFPDILDNVNPDEMSGNTPAVLPRKPAGVFPDILDNVNPDEMAREYLDRIGSPAKMLRATTEVEQIRATRAQQQQAAQAAEMAGPLKDGVEAAKLLSETTVGGAPALDNMLGV